MMTKPNSYVGSNQGQDRLRENIAAASANNELEQAIVQFKCGVDEGKPELWSLLALSQVQFESGNADAAYNTAFQALDIFSDKALLHAVLARVQSLNDLSLAETHANKALEFDPEDAEVRAVCDRVAAVHGHPPICRQNARQLSVHWPGRRRLA